MKWIIGKICVNKHVAQKRPGVRNEFLDACRQCQKVLPSIAVNFKKKQKNIPQLCEDIDNGRNRNDATDGIEIFVFLYQLLHVLLGGVSLFLNFVTIAGKFYYYGKQINFLSDIIMAKIRILFF